MNLRLKTVFRRDEIQRHFRLFRVLWERGEVGFGNGGYSAKLSVALTPRLWGFSRNESHDLLITVLGLRVGYTRSYGGIFA